MKLRRLSRYCLILPALLLTACAASTSGSQPFLAGAGLVNDFSLSVQSMEDRRFLTVVRQRYDFSCGSAALATLLHYHYRDPQTEGAVFQGMWRDGDRAQIRKVGFSLLDMKQYLMKRGVAADGFKVSLDRIADAGLPGIALLNVNGYRHFVVVKGVTTSEVLLGDPSLGLRVVSRREFEAGWNGIYFVLSSRLDVGKGNFNGDRQWVAFSRAPIGASFVEPLSQQALMLTAPFYGDF